ncbi:MFS transporter [Gallaecimonas mangrovi]|uniref:MFS transporter n=1 Tax=Gallaecimonas mangrovi TaxID=2291597 RepID=UPI0018685555|nr:MFS transporter [Gallaecimonas mangrovi]
MWGRDLLTLLLIVALSFFLMCDVFITPAIIQELSQEFAVTDVQLSLASSSFVVFGAIVGLVVGYQTDRLPRKGLFIGVVLLGELPCLLTGVTFFSGSFWSFVVLRTLTGIGVGGIYPLTFSMLSDYFSVKHRATASAMVDFAWGIGMVCGPLLAITAAATNYGWRWAFIWAALPSFPLLLLFFLVAREPKRGATEPRLTHQVHAMGFRHWLELWRKKTNLLVFLQGLPGSIPWGLFPFWLIVIFSNTQHFSREQATYIWELFGISAGIGGVMWALVGDRLFLKEPKLLPLLCCLGVLFGIIPCFLIFNGWFVSVTSCALLAGVAGISISVPASNCKAILMNVNHPEHRGSVFSVYNLCDNIGKGLGPALGGLLLSVSGSYVVMANVAIALWLICGCIFALMISVINRDRAQVLMPLSQPPQSVDEPFLNVGKS